MNRRTFFTSLASLGIAPHPHERLADLVDDASPQYLLTKGTRPFSGNAPITLADPAAVTEFFVGRTLSWSGTDVPTSGAKVTVTSINKRSGSFSYVSDLVDSDYVFRASRP